jgi:hypothetical protein
MTSAISAPRPVSILEFRANLRGVDGSLLQGSSTGLHPRAIHFRFVDCVSTGVYHSILLLAREEGAARGTVSSARKPVMRETTLRGPWPAHSGRQLGAHTLPPLPDPIPSISRSRRFMPTRYAGLLRAGIPPSQSFTPTDRNSLAPESSLA